jgi:small subunit ribosomal protein S1
MSTPETPPQSPTSPVASDAASAPLEPSAPSVDAASNGRPDEVSTLGEGESSAEATEPGETTTSQPVGEGGPPAGAGAEKKRRRRRRRRKPGAQAGGEAGAPGAGENEPSESSEPASESEASEGEADSGPETHAADKDDTAPPGRTQSLRDRKREKRHGPPRERPPVTAGDIVFGKIVEITDEAIFVDIPGKARAIFDRRELLLQDDDEAKAPAATEAVPPRAAVASEDHAPGGAPPAPPDPDGSAPGPGDAPAEHEDVQASDTSDEGEPAEGSSAADEAEEQPHVSAEPALAQAPSSPPEPPKEPKVPRVILETGADFIAVVHNDGARGGLVVLSHHPNRAERTKPLVEKAFQDKATTLGLVTGVIKGGIEVDVDGLRAFAPGSHVDLRMGADLSHLVGKRLAFLVTQYAKRGRDVVLSRKSIIEEEAR